MGCGCCKADSSSDMHEALLHPSRSNSICSISSYTSDDLALPEDNIKLKIPPTEKIRDDITWPKEGFLASRHWPDVKPQHVQILLVRKSLRFHPINAGKYPSRKQKLRLCHIMAVHKGSGYLAVPMPECFACIETTAQFNVYLELETPSIRDGFVQLLVDSIQSEGLTVTRLKRHTLAEEQKLAYSYHTEELNDRGTRSFAQVPGFNSPPSSCGDTMSLDKFGPDDLEWGSAGSPA